MLSRIYEFGRRHRRKVFVASALAGGLVLAGKIAEYKFKSWRDEETRGYLERVRKQHHFESTERTGNLTMVSLFPGLVNKIEQCLDSESVLKEIKDTPQASNSNRRQ